MISLKRLIELLIKLKRYKMEPEKILDLVIGFFCKENEIDRKPKNIEDINSALNILKKQVQQKNFNALYILNYLHENIASEKKRKRKVTARDFEDFIALFFNGNVTDEEARKNQDVICEIHDSYVKGYAISNRREKGDVAFDNFVITVKTFMPDNNEINCGSFAREALFKDFLEDYGGERKSGLGSKPQILERFQEIERTGKWKDFSERFKEMVECIYSDDLLCAIKGGDYLDIYTLEGKKFRDLLMEKLAKGPKEAIGIINRYEGNTLRIERDKILGISKKIHFDFKEFEPNNVLLAKKIIQKFEENVILVANNAIDDSQFKSNLEILCKELEKIIL
jgi:hypothetical protein